MDSEHLEKGGEGSRGGKVIGHTKSGKPVYKDKKSGNKTWGLQDHADAHRLHLTKKFDAQDAGNKEAADTHSEMGRHHYKESELLLQMKGERSSEYSNVGIKKSETYPMNQELRKALQMYGANHPFTQKLMKAAPKGVDEAKYKRCKAKVKEKSPEVNEYAVCAASLRKSFFEKLRKAGEGSRGGNIIGHTRSGKPIYGDKQPKHHQGFSNDDHFDAAAAVHAYRQHNTERGSTESKALSKRSTMHLNLSDKEASPSILLNHATHHKLHQTKEQRLESREKQRTEKRRSEQMKQENIRSGAPKL